MTDRIITKRLTLRRYLPSDAEVVTDLIGNLDVTRWLTRAPYPYALEHAQGFIAAPLIQTAAIFAICKNDTLIGGVSINPDLGYWLGEPYWGYGFMTEAAGALVEYYWRDHDQALTSGYILGNDGSASVLRKLGFKESHTENADSAALGRKVTVQKVRLSKSDWRARP